MVVHLFLQVYLACLLEANGLVVCQRGMVVPISYVTVEVVELNGQESERAV